MRFTSLLTDLIFLMPSLYLLLNLLSFSKSKSIPIFNMSLLVLYLKPDQILVDHGHFQYNSLMLGLIIYALYCMLTKKYYVCCVFFTIALNCKQMSFYYAFGFLFGLIGLTYQQYKRRIQKFIVQLIIYGAIVIGVTVIIWLPWMRSWAEFSTVLGAIFPIHRGLYQLKVPNFWCISDVIFKWQNMFSKSFLMFLCMLVSSLASFPAIVSILIKPSKSMILLGFSTIGMCFFMFSYHVH